MQLHKLQSLKKTTFLTLYQQKLHGGVHKGCVYCRTVLDLVTKCKGISIFMVIHEVTVSQRLCKISTHH